MSDYVAPSFDLVGQQAQQDGPVITSFSPSSSVEIGAKITLAVTTSGGGPITCVWKKDGVQLPNSTNKLHTIYSFQSSDAGSYIVIVSNPNGSATSNPAVLSVAGTPPPPPPPPPPPSGTTAFAGIQSLGALRNNYAGWVGDRVVVGANPITVTQLGRIMVSGNTGTHALKLVNAATEQDIASVSISMSGTPGTFKYGVLPTPVVLAAGSTVWVLTQETSGGDQWHDHAGTVLTPASVAAITGLIWGGPPWSQAVVGANECFGPVSFMYETTGAPPPPAGQLYGNLQVDAARISIGHGDNLPVTWGADGNIYTAYSDGYGFGGSVNLSTGQAKILGSAPSITGQNIPSPTGEFTGDGAFGRKASGLLMSGGVLYEFIRNLNTDGTGSYLGWSSNLGSSWVWAAPGWTMPPIGYPTWLNAGQDFGARQDGYAYFYSPDGPSAYIAYPNLMMARVPVGSITNPATYQYFGGLDGSGQPIWTTSFAARGSCFSNGAGIFRPSVVYNPGIGRYLLTMTNAYNAPSNYLGVFEAPKPWGPWTQVAYINGWGYPENRFQPQIPSKWISADGLSFYIQYSCYPNGPYQFNIQRATISAI